MALQTTNDMVMPFVCLGDKNMVVDAATRMANVAAMRMGLAMAMQMVDGKSMTVAMATTKVGVATPRMGCAGSMTVMVVVMTGIDFAH